MAGDASSCSLIGGRLGLKLAIFKVVAQVSSEVTGSDIARGRYKPSYGRLMKAMNS